MLGSENWREATSGLCPTCLRTVPTVLFEENGRVWIEQSCPKHGVQKALLASDAGEYLRLRQFVPPRVGAACCCGPGETCDPGKPPTCVLLLEITQACNLSCPTCYADAHGHNFLSVDDARKRLETFFAYEQSHLDILMISGGEPTIHPQFEQIIEMALEYPIERILINTNGIRLVQSDGVLNAVAKHKEKVELYLSFSSLRRNVQEHFYGKDLMDQKLAAIERAKSAGIFVTLVATVENGVNQNELGDLYRLCLKHENINGLALQPVMDTGRYDHQFQPAERMTMTGAISELCEQSNGALIPADFVGLPCSHPDCCALTYGFLDKTRSTILPLPRILDVGRYLDLFADKISFSGLMSSAARRVLADILTPKRGRSLGDISALLAHDAVRDLIPLIGKPEQFGKRVFRIVIKPFMDAHTYDHKRIDQCCTKIVDETGAAVSFCEYNVFRRGRTVNAKSGLTPLTIVK